jgi:hypothetical protein
MLEKCKSKKGITRKARVQCRLDMNQALARHIEWSTIFLACSKLMPDSLSSTPLIASSTSPSSFGTFARVGEAGARRPKAEPDAPKALGGLEGALKPPKPPKPVPAIEVVVGAEKALKEETTLRGGEEGEEGVGAGAGLVSSSAARGGTGGR